MQAKRFCAGLLASVAVAAACAAADVQRIGATPQLAAMPAVAGPFAPSPARAALGRQAFFDPRLSEPAGTSCASCHDPRRAFSGNHGSRLGVPLGARADLVGLRNTPSALYVAYVPRLFFYQDDDALAATPFGGLFADGRADDVPDLVRHPLMNPLEMHNRSLADVARKLRAAPYADGLRREFGARALDTTAGALAALGKAMESFLQSREMAPFSSRYDAWVQGKAPLTALELRGLKLFKNPDKGNCASCHKFNETSSNPARSLFTDFGYDAIGVPRNRAIPATRDPAYFDTGLCATAAAATWPERAQWCGYFRTPGLRNVAVRERFMHNGAFSTLRDAVAFYATRGIEPERWYKDGVLFDDVPKAYRGNVNAATLPYNRRKGMQPALDDAEIDAIVAFLRTLTDAPWETRAP
ncbi:cytochrome-c peroxidase [uncultured Massilia sp.]|uniref:cytochrome-c peroxidase n=1 Tax=uncultured Massilia sp. TaxID=169973 RepID=UPI0025F3ABD0|nr:cytochrome c peroxidase [uncultured Massilia sp.]